MCVENTFLTEQYVCLENTFSHATWERYTIWEHIVDMKWEHIVHMKWEHTFRRPTRDATDKFCQYPCRFPATHCNTLLMFRQSLCRFTATHCYPLQYTATRCNTPQGSANTLLTFRQSPCRFTATHYNTLQHTATHCNTLQHTAYVSPIPFPIFMCSIGSAAKGAPGTN